MKPFRLVVAAVIVGNDGRFLLTLRLPKSHMGGLWEFPGGTVEDGETPDVALARELAEELGVAAEIGNPLTFAWHADDQRRVLLLFFRVSIVVGQPQGLEGQEVGWFTVDELAALPVPPADAELVRLLAKKTI